MVAGRPKQAVQFVTLDAVRGIAAIVVLVWHTQPAWGWRPASGYLAVDLFFVLSGFVLAWNYDPRLGGTMTARHFMLVRLIRLYPLYILGTAVSVAGLLFALAVGAHNNWTPANLVASIVSGAAFAPGAAANGMLYPLNPPAWSLMFELVVNLAFAAAFRRLTTRRLLLTSAAAFAALVVTTIYFGSLNTGSTWSNWWGGFPRVFFSFPLGVLLCRLYRDRGWRLPGGVVLPIAVTVLCLGIKPAWREAYDLVVTLLVFPAIVLMGASSQPKRFVRPLTFLGATSYAIYVLHVPLWALYARGLALVLGHDLPVLLSGVVFLAVTVVAAWLADLLWDKPWRKWLTRRTKAGRPIAAVAQ